MFAHMWIVVLCIHCTLTKYRENLWVEIKFVYVLEEISLSEIKAK